MDLRTSALVACLAWALGATIAAIGMLTYANGISSQPAEVKVDNFRQARSQTGQLTLAARNQLDRQAQLAKDLSGQVSRLQTSLMDARKQLNASREESQALKRESDKSMDLVIELLEADRLRTAQANLEKPTPVLAEAVDAKPMDPNVVVAAGGGDTIESLKQQLMATDQEIEALEIEHEASMARMFAREVALRDESTRILTRIGGVAAGQIAESLRHRDPEIRIWAASVLEKLGPLATDALGDLQAVSKDSDARVREAVGKAQRAIID